MTPDAPAELRPHFAPTHGFRKELVRRVHEHMAAHGLKERDVPAQYFKALVILAWVALGYAFILFAQVPWPVLVVGCVVLGLGTAAMVMNIGHDANHGAFSRHRWVNALLSLTFDFNGATGTLWRYRHNVIHHTYTNIVGVDYDISSAAPFMRMTPRDTFYPFHRFQWLYFPFLYIFLTANWLITDFVTMFVTGKYLDLHVPRPTVSDKIMWLVGKLVVVCIIVVMPTLAGREPLEIFVGMLVHYGVMGGVLALVFQLAHVVEEVEMIQMDDKGARLDDEFAVHQLRTSADFAPDSRVLNWYLGGLNFQAIHHLLPNISHANYPAIYPVVVEVAREWKVPYRVFPDAWTPVRSHYRKMRSLSIPPVTSPAMAQPAAQA